MPEPLHVVLLVRGGRAPGLEAGLQRGRDDLDAGEPTEGGRRYDADLTVRRREDGTVRYTGPSVFGPATEPFLYVSYRRPGAADWTRRSKVLLPVRLEEGTGTLEATVSDVGATRARLEDPGWEQRP